MKNILRTAIFMVMILSATLSSFASVKPLHEAHRNQNNSSTNHLWIADTVWRYDTINGKYDLNSSNIYRTYDAQNRLTGFVFQIVDSAGWLNRTQNLYTYSSNSDTVNVLYQDWTAGAWVNTQRFALGYDAHGNNTFETNQTWNGTGWDNSYQRIYTYNSQNLEIKKESQIWGGSAWTTDRIDTFSYVYDANNNITGVLDKKDNNGTWENYEQFRYGYDANHNKTFYADQLWDNNAWVVQEEHHYKYDSNNNSISDSIQSFDGTSLVDYEWYTFHYDADNDTVYALLQIFNNGAWIKADSIHYYYRNLSGIESLVTDAGASVSVFPNPASQYVKIVNHDASTIYQTVSLVDITGKVLLSQIVVVNEIQLNVGAITAGIYQAILMNDRGERLVKRVVIE